MRKYIPTKRQKTRLQQKKRSTKKIEKRTRRAVWARVKKLVTPKPHKKKFSTRLALLHRTELLKKIFWSAVTSCLIITSTLGSGDIPLVHAASSWSPTLLVNTEAFQVIDDADTSANVVLRFGGTINKSLSYFRSLSRFQFDDDVYVTGSGTFAGTMSGRSLFVTGTGATPMLATQQTTGRLGIGTSLPDAKLDVIGTVSGTTIYGQQSLRSSGSLVWEGAASGSRLYVGTSINGAGLIACTGTNKLLWDATTGRFSCSADLTGGGGNFGSGNVVAIGNPRYVNTAGDTMTGALFITSTSASPLLNVGDNGGSSTNVMSIYNNRIDVTEQTEVSPGPLYLNANGASVGIGKTTLPKATLDVVGTVSGSNLTFGTIASYILGNLSLGKSTAAKAKLDVVGIMSGTTVYATQSFSGAGLTTCSNPTNSKLLWNSATGRFSCGTDQTGGGGAFGSGNVFALGNPRFVNTAGDTMTGALSIQNGNTHAFTATPLLNVRGTISGTTLKTGNGISASGAVMLEGSLTGATIAGFGLIDCDTAASSKLLWDTTTKKFSCGTDQTGAGGSSPPWAGVLHAAMGDGNSIYVTRSMEVLNSVAGPTPTIITTSVARCVLYRAQYAITVNRVRLFGVGATTSLYKFAVYPRGTGAARLWESGTVTSVANAWLSISAATPFTLAANTDYWFCVTVANVGTTAGFRSPPAPISTNQFGADAAPLGGRSMGLPVFVQFAVTAGAFPATLPAVAAAAYSAAATGSVPFAFFDNSSI
jgi:hypothetical protein